MSEKTYNGWTNYETWNVKLLMDNDEGSYHMNQERAQEIFDRADGDTPEEKADDAKTELAKALKDEYENASCGLLDNAGLSASVWADLLGAALSEVNWYEIAASLVDEVAEREPT